jgi:hypothetical protein
MLAIEADRLNSPGIALKYREQGARPLPEIDRAPIVRWECKSGSCTGSPASRD